MQAQPLPARNGPALRPIEDANWVPSPEQCNRDLQIRAAQNARPVSNYVPPENPLPIIDGAEGRRIEWSAEGRQLGAAKVAALLEVNGANLVIEKGRLALKGSLPADSETKLRVMVEAVKDELKALVKEREALVYLE